MQSISDYKSFRKELERVNIISPCMFIDSIALFFIKIDFGDTHALLLISKKREI